MIDTNTVLLVLVVVAWGVFVSVMMLSGEQKCRSIERTKRFFSTGVHTTEDTEHGFYKRRRRTRTTRRDKLKRTFL